MSVLEPLRRSTRNTLLVTDLIIGVLPLILIARSGMDLARVAVVVPAIAALLFMHARSVVRALHGSWQPFPLRRTYLLSVLATFVTCVMALTDGSAGTIGSLYAGLAVSEFAIGREPQSTYRHVGIAMAAHTAALAGVIILSGQFGTAGETVVFAPVLVVFTAYSVGVAYRQWEAALKIEEARRAADELATTRERLRLAEDLHDILGHALEVVSLKSELAARIEDPARARTEMIEVQRLARNALKDVRALAKGNRPTDLAIELAGARKLLESAGITCDFDADPALLSEPERELFGRVLREAMTNALRHADPKTCAVSLTVGPDKALLRVVNDGTASLDTPDQGSGLTGLTRRVKAAGGEFSAGGVEPSSFEVTASLPR